VVVLVLVNLHLLFLNGKEKLFTDSNILNDTETKIEDEDSQELKQPQKKARGRKPGGNKDNEDSQYKEVSPKINLDDPNLDSFLGFKVAVTGSFGTMTRKQIESWVEELGGQMAKSVSNLTTILVAGSDKK
jgi:NAD-dependent DNA ligase